MKTLNLAFREAAILLAASVLLGLFYTAVARKGLFGRSAGLSSEAEVLTAPEMISLEEARALFSSGEGAFIDTRDEFLYKTGHIRGALHVSPKELEARIDELRELSGRKVLIPYCDGENCHSSIEFSNRLFAAGISNVKVFFGGWEEWTASQLPTERSAP